jgi:hypothetical protein
MNFVTAYHGPQPIHSLGVMQHWLPPHPGPLPWGEGELQPVVVVIGRCVFARLRSKGLPLPKGEGRGEGEQTARTPDAHNLCLGSGKLPLRAPWPPRL